MSNNNWNPQILKPSTWLPSANSQSSNRDNGYYHNNNNNGNKGRGGRGGRGQQIQSQTYAQQQNYIQKTADMKMFRDQVNNTFISIEQAALLSQNPQFGDDVVNAATDGAVLTLDMFAVTCGEFCKRSDNDAVDLAKKTVYDKWSQLQQRDLKTYNLTKIYRDFLIAALNGNNDLRFKQYRVASSRLDVEAANNLKNNPNALHDTYQNLIVNSQKFEREQQEIRNNPDKAKAVKQQYDKEIHQFRNGGGSKQKQQHYTKPELSNFYFTKTGQSAKFQGMNELNESNGSEPIEMKRDLYGNEDAYADLKKKYPNYPYQNAKLLLSKDVRLGKFSKPIPCKILYPGDKHQGTVFDKIRVRPAFPHNDSIMAYSVDMICCDVNQVRKCETSHTKKYKQLGYESIENQENNMMEWE